MIVEFEGEMFRWDARKDAWYFTSLPAELSAEIREIPRPGRGFGAVRVHAHVGSSAWKTSIFPGGDGVYVLPLKRSVREAEGLERDSVVGVRLEILDA
ncbi:MAG: DUF1905 domain-containing protein [Actinobacteria bacterium]|nr:DUF1905 domain-containing protein [Actinomycetota bacterium]